MSDEIILREIEVTKLRMRPGDVLVVHLPENTRHSWMQRLALHLQKILPRNPALLIANNVTLTIASPEEAQELAKKIKEGTSGTKG